jgi:hypothetical protein
VSLLETDGDDLTVVRRRRRASGIVVDRRLVANREAGSSSSLRSSTTISRISSPSATKTDEGYDGLDLGKTDSLGCFERLIASGTSSCFTFSYSVSSGTGSSVEGEEGGAIGSSTSSVCLRVITLRMISLGEGSRSVAARVSIILSSSCQSRPSVALCVDLLVTDCEGNASWTE